MKGKTDTDEEAAARELMIEEALYVLNRACEADRDAMENLLLRKRSTCNDALRDDPTIQVLVEGDTNKVGFIGIVNGIFGADAKGWGFLAAIGDVVCAVHGVRGTRAYEPCDMEGCDRTLSFHLTSFGRTK